jgi:hypothetical protein
MTHKHYYQIQAKTYYDLGLALGESFGDVLLDTLEEEKADKREWQTQVEESKHYLPFCQKAFPHLIEELKGYAHAAGASFEDLWALSLEDELDDDDYEKCTTLVTNEGMLIGHNEDWTPDAKDWVCLLEKTVGDLTVFELFYMNGLGGNSISINSHGVVHAINTLTHSDYQMGIPRTISARWLSETASPRDDIKHFQTLQRSSGFHHTLLDIRGQCWSLECSARKSFLTQPSLPFAHSNHYLSELTTLEEEDDTEGTYQRLDCARQLMTPQMQPDDLQRVLEDDSQGPAISLHNERTIASIIIDLEHREANVWLAREHTAGWLSYPLTFIDAW